MRYTFPSGYADAPCYVVAINRDLIPIVAAQLRLLEARGSWASADDYEQGYRAIVELEACLMATCLNDLIESNDRLYRMLDTAIFGVGYTVESVDPLLVTPAIPPQRTMGVYDDASVLGRMETMRQLLENALNGTETPQYDEALGVRERLQQIKEAIEAIDTDDSDVVGQLELIVGLLA